MFEQRSSGDLEMKKIVVTLIMAAAVALAGWRRCQVPPGQREKPVPKVRQGRRGHKVSRACRDQRVTMAMPASPAFELFRPMVWSVVMPLKHLCRFSVQAAELLMVRNAIRHQQSGFASNSDNKWQQADFGRALTYPTLAYSPLRPGGSSCLPGLVQGISRVFDPALTYPPGASSNGSGNPSSRGSWLLDGEPRTTSFTISMISRTISPRSLPELSLSRY
jgi:hypothetical protein